jgi:hypothetical protein
MFARGAQTLKGIPKIAASRDPQKALQRNDRPRRRGPSDTEARAVLLADQRLGFRRVAGLHVRGVPLDALLP